MADKNKTMARLEMEMAVKGMMDNLDLLFEQHIGFAKTIYNYYLELQNAGFSKAEALEIVKAHGMFPPMNSK